MSNRTTEDKKSLEYQITTLIEEGKFDEANECQISMLPSGSRIENEKIYFNFLTRCVTKMCQEGNFDEATAFINAKSLYFAHERDWMNQKAVYTRWEAEEALSKIVESYKDTDKDK